jgi:hypothetical protein
MIAIGKTAVRRHCRLYGQSITASGVELAQRSLARAKDLRFVDLPSGAYSRDVRWFTPKLTMQIEDGPRQRFP